ncbi:MAG: 16S rRNA (uracil(1498)-N(3))-methyltransferase [Kiritimatiellae bacterium]|nr:16S rRNA (uracil(1498)-N(3))-methyltransferase [Kiritimatiellia bacterium]
MNIILLEKSELSSENIAVLDGRRFEHIKNVLRAVPDDLLRVGIVGEKRYQARLLDMGESSCTIKIEDELPSFSEPRLDLILALPRPKCMKRLWAQLSAIGFKRIFIVNAEKVEKVYWGSTTLAEDVYKPLLLEGLEQCGDTVLPEVCFVKRLRPFLEDEALKLFDNQQKIIAHPYDGKIESVSQEELAGKNERRVVAIGPEGGWNDFELGLFAQSGFKSLSLGERILRTDTAVISIAALLK